MDTGLAKERRPWSAALARGWAAPAPPPWRGKGVAVTITARTAGRIGARTADGDPHRRPAATMHHRRGRHHYCQPGRAAALAACPSARHSGDQCRRPAAGGLPRLAAGGLGARRLDANMLTPIALIKAVIDGMTEPQVSAVS